MINYHIASGNPSEVEVAALDQALALHERPKTLTPVKVSAWAKPQLRSPLKRKM